MYAVSVGNELHRELLGFANTNGEMQKLIDDFMEAMGGEAELKALGVWFNIECGC